MGKWMIIGVFAGLLLPFGTTLIVTGNIPGNTVQQAAGENGCRQLPHLFRPVRWQ
ncbi:MAG: hypothetical protein V8R61_02650 [Enterocloster sp.]